MKKYFFLAVLAAILAVVTYYYFPEGTIDSGQTVDKVVVSKKAHRMEVYSGTELLRSYSISHVKKPDNLDDFEDRSVPAGTYFIFDKDARSKYHKSLGFSLERASPNDAVNEKEAKKKKKAAFRIHGMKRGYGFIGKFHRWRDWTKGGIALTDNEVDDLFNHVEIGTTVVVTE
jgi:lipoprotein-anchoring transpeptidase ErfK/SrfK